MSVHGVFSAILTTATLSALLLPHAGHGRARVDVGESDGVRGTIRDVIDDVRPRAPDTSFSTELLQLRSRNCTLAQSELLLLFNKCAVGGVRIESGCQCTCPDGKTITTANYKRESCAPLGALELHDTLAQGARLALEVESALTKAETLNPGSAVAHVAASATGGGAGEDGDQRTQQASPDGENPHAGSGTSQSPVSGFGGDGDGDGAGSESEIPGALPRFGGGAAKATSLRTSPSRRTGKTGTLSAGVSFVSDRIDSKKPATEEKAKIASAEAIASAPGALEDSDVGTPSSSGAAGASGPEITAASKGEVAYGNNAGLAHTNRSLFEVVSRRYEQVREDMAIYEP